MGPLASIVCLRTRCPAPFSWITKPWRPGFSGAGSQSLEMPGWQRAALGDRTMGDIGDFLIWWAVLLVLPSSDSTSLWHILLRWFCLWKLGVFFFFIAKNWTEGDTKKKQLRWGSMMINDWILGCTQFLSFIFYLSRAISSQRCPPWNDSQQNGNRPSFAETSFVEMMVYIYKTLDI